MFLNNACNILTCEDESLEYLEATLNSKPILWYSFITNMNKTGVGDMQMGAQNFNALPIPKQLKEKGAVCELVRKIHARNSTALMGQIETLIESFYNFTDEEKSFISSFASEIYGDANRERGH